MTEQNQQPPDEENNPTSNQSKNQQSTPSENDNDHSQNPSEIHPDKITNLLEKIIGVPASQFLKRWLNNNNNIIVRNSILIIGAISTTCGGIIFFSPVSNNYQEVKIQEIDLQVLCANPSIYLPKLQEEGYSETEYNILDEGAVLLEGEKVQNIYPVFRWVCEYKLTRKNQLPENESRQAGEGRAMNFQTSLNMDEDFCQRRFGEMNLNKATYHDHNDPHSWHCTNTEFDLN